MTASSPSNYEANQGGSPRTTQNRKVYDRFLLSQVQKDNLKVGNKGSSGNLRDGKSVPKSRPTLLWQPEILDAKFDYQSYLEKKNDREAAHQRKLSQWANKQDKLEVEIKELEIKMSNIDLLVNQNVSEYEKQAPLVKDIKKKERLEKLDKSMHSF